MTAPFTLKPSALVAAAHVIASDGPGEVVRKLDAAFDAAVATHGDLDADMALTIDQRDTAEGWADGLAALIGKYFGRDVGEHSSAHCTPARSSSGCACPGRCEWTGWPRRWPSAALPYRRPTPTQRHPMPRMRCAWDWVRCLCRNWRPYSFSCGIPWKAFPPEPAGPGPGSAALRFSAARRAAARRVRVGGGGRGADPAVSSKF